MHIGSGDLNPLSSHSWDSARHPEQSHLSERVSKSANSVFKSPLFWATLLIATAITFTAFPLAGMMALAMTIYVPIATTTGTAGFIFLILSLRGKKKNLRNLSSFATQRLRRRDLAIKKSEKLIRRAKAAKLKSTLHRPIQQNITQPPPQQLQRKFSIQAVVKPSNNPATAAEDIKELKGAAARETKESKAKHQAEVKQHQLGFAASLGISPRTEWVEAKEKSSLENPEIAKHVTCQVMGGSYLSNSTLGGVSLEGTRTPLVAQSMLEFLQSKTFEDNFSSQKPALSHLVNSLQDIVRAEDEITAYKNEAHLEIKDPKEIDTQIEDKTRAWYGEWISQKIKNLKVGESLTVRGGWIATSGGHAMLHILTRTGATKVSMATLNTGTGREFHPGIITTSRESQKHKISPVLIKKEIDLSDIAKPQIWETHFDLKYVPQKNNDEDWRNANYIYTRWLESISEGYLTSAIEIPYEKYITPQSAGTCPADLIFALANLLLSDQSIYKRFKLFYKSWLTDKTIIPAIDLLEKEVASGAHLSLERIRAIQGELNLYQLLVQDFARSVNKGRGDEVITSLEAQGFSKQVEAVSKRCKMILKQAESLALKQKLRFTGLEKGPPLVLKVADKILNLESKEKAEKETYRIHNPINTAFPKTENPKEILAQLEAWNKSTAAFSLTDPYEQREAYFTIQEILKNFPTASSSAWMFKDPEIGGKIAIEVSKLQQKFYETLRQMPLKSKVRAEHAKLMGKCLQIINKLFCKAEEVEFDLDRDHFVNKAHLFSQNPKENFDQPDNLERGLFPFILTRLCLNETFKPTSYGNELYRIPHNINLKNPVNHIDNEVHLVTALLSRNPKLCEELRKQIIRNGDHMISSKHSDMHYPIYKKDKQRILSNPNYYEQMEKAGKLPIISDSRLVACCLAKSEYLPLFHALRTSAMISFFVKEGNSDGLITEPLEGLVVVGVYEENDGKVYLIPSSDSLNKLRSNTSERAKNLSYYGKSPEYRPERHFEIQKGQSSISPEELEDLFRITKEINTQNQIIANRNLINKSLGSAITRHINDPQFYTEFRLLQSTDDKATHHISNTIALFNKYRTKLLNPDYQFLFEAQIFSEHHLEETLKRDPSFIKVLGEFVRDGYQLALAKPNISAALFFLRMGSYFSHYAKSHHLPNLIEMTELLFKTHDLSETDRSLIMRERLAHYAREGVTQKNCVESLKELMRYNLEAELPDNLTNYKLNDDINFLAHQIHQIVKSNPEEISEAFGEGYSFNYPYLVYQNKKIDIREGVLYENNVKSGGKLSAEMLASPIFKELFSDVAAIKNIRPNKKQIEFTYKGQEYRALNPEDIQILNNGEFYNYGGKLAQLSGMSGLSGVYWKRQGSDEGVVTEIESGKIIFKYQGGDLISTETATNGYRIDKGAYAEQLTIRKFLSTFDANTKFWIPPDKDKVEFIEMPLCQMKFKVIWENDQVKEIVEFPNGEYRICENQTVKGFGRLSKRVLVLENIATKTKKVILKGEKINEQSLSSLNMDADIDDQISNVKPTLYEYIIDSSGKLVGGRIDSQLYLIYAHIFRRDYESALNALNAIVDTFEPYKEKERALIYQILNDLKMIKDPRAAALRVLLYDRLSKNIENFSFHLTLEENEKFEISFEDLQLYLSSQSHIPKRFRVEGKSLEKMKRDFKDTLVELKSKKIKKRLRAIEKRLGMCNLKNPTKIDLNNLPSVIGSEKFIEKNFYSLYLKAIDPQISLKEKEQLKTFLKLSNDDAALLLFEALKNPTKFPLSHQINPESLVAPMSQENEIDEINFEWNIPQEEREEKRKKAGVETKETAALEIERKANFTKSLLEAEVEIPSQLFKPQESKIGAERKEVLEVLHQAINKNRDKRVTERSLKELEESLNTYYKNSNVNYEVNLTLLSKWEEKLHDEKTNIGKLETAALQELLLLSNKKPEDLTARVERDNQLLGLTLKKIKLDDLLAVFLHQKGDITPEGIAEYQKLNSALTPVEIRNLHQQIKEYLLLSTQKQKIQRILNAISIYKDDPNNNTAKDLFQEAHAVRQYDPNLYPSYLVFENKMNLLIWEKQREALDQLISGKSIALQLGMGSGKSEVLAALNAMQKADGEHLSIIMVPQELLQTTCGLLQRQLGDIFYQKLQRVNWSATNEEGVENILSRLEQIRENRQVLIVTDKEMRSFDLASKAACYNDDFLFQKFKSVTDFLKSKGFATIDEIHRCLNTRQDSRKAVADPVPLNQSTYQMSLHLFHALLNDPKIAQKYSFEFRPSSSSTAKPFSPPFDVSTKQLLIKHGLDWISQNWGAQIKEKFEEINQFLNDQGDCPDLDPNLSELLCILKGHLEVLPYTLSSSHKEKYGLFQEQATGKNVFSTIAGPYLSAGVPNYGSEFSSALERIFFTVQSYLATPEGLFKILSENIKKMQESTQGELVKGVVRNVEQSSGFKNFRAHIDRNCTPDKFLQLSKKEIETLVQEIWKDQSRLNLILEHYILPKIEVYKSSLVSDPWSLFGLFKTVTGFTGTPKEDLHAKFDRVDYEPGANGKVLAIIARDSADKQIRLKDGLNTNELLNRLFPANGSHLACFDPGAILKNVPPIQAARHILHARSDINAPNYLSSVTFFQDDVEMVLVRGKDDPVPAKQLEANLTANGKTFLLLYQPYCTGTNKRLPKNATGLMTISSSLSYSDASQAAMRLRKLGSGQTVECVALESTYALAGATLGKPAEKVNAVDLLLFTKLTEAEKQSEENWISAKQAIRNVIVNEAMEIFPLVESDTFKYNLLETLSDKFFDQYKKAQTLEEVEKVFDELIEDSLKLVVPFYPESIKDREELLKEKLTNIKLKFLNVQRPLLNTKITATSQEQGQEVIVQVQVQQETAKQQETETEKETETEIETKYAIDSRDLFAAKDITRISIDLLEKHEFPDANQAAANLMKSNTRDASSNEFFKKMSDAIGNRAPPILQMGNVVEKMSQLNIKLPFSKHLFSSLDFLATVNDWPFGKNQKPLGKVLIVRGKKDPDNFKMVLLSGKEAEEMQLKLQDRSKGASENYDITLYDPRLDHFYPDVIGNLKNDKNFMECCVQYYVMAGLIIPDKLEKYAKQWIKQSVQATSPEEFEQFYLKLIANNEFVKMNYEQSKIKQWIFE